MVGVRKALHYAVVRDGNGSVAPAVSTLYDILGLGNPVEIAHLGMTVQFYTLMGGRIRPHRDEIRNLLDAREGAYGNLMVEFVHGSHAFELYKDSGLQTSQKLRDKLCLHKKLYGDGIRKIRDVEHHNGSFVADLTAVRFQDFSADGHISHFADDLVNGNDLFVKIFSVNHVGIVGLL